MADSDKIINKLTDTIDSAINDTENAFGAFDKQLLAQMEILLKDLDLDSNGNIIRSAKNNSLISKVKQKLQSIIRSNPYNDAIKDLTSTLSDITDIQHEYFAGVNEDYSPHANLDDLQQQTVNDTVDALKSRGVQSDITDKITEILQTHIKEGMPYTEILKELRSYLTDNGGPLASYAKQIATDSLNTYSRTYDNMVADDLGLEWRRYVGAKIKTTRDLCKACLAKEWIHQSEIPNIIKGNFKEFKAIDGKINPATGYPYGWIEGTNASNWPDRAGGYGCNHRPIPVSAAMVPEYIRSKFD